MNDENPDYLLGRISILEEREKYLDDWLTNLDEAQEVASEVIAIRDQTTWALDALRNRPEEASEIILNLSDDQLEEENQFIMNAIPQIPRYELSLIMSSTSTSGSGSATVYEFIGQVGDLGTEDPIEYANVYKGKYQALQKEQNRPQQVKELIEKLGSPGTTERFDSAYHAYMDYRINSAKRKSAASEMRTLLAGITGVLFIQARRWPKENMTWEIMSSRLNSGGEGSYEHQQLRNFERRNSSLISRLSDVLKGREGGSVTNVDDIWIELLDHIYSILGLIDFD